MQETFKASNWLTFKHFWSKMLLPTILLVAIITFSGIKADADPWSLVVTIIVGVPAVMLMTYLYSLRNPEKVIVDDIGIRGINKCHTIPIRWNHVTRLEQCTIPIRRLGNVTVYVVTGGELKIVFANVPATRLYGEYLSAENERQSHADAPLQKAIFETIFIPRDLSRILHILQNHHDTPQQEAIFIPVEQVDALKNRIIRKGQLELTMEGQWQKHIPVSQETMEPWWITEKAPSKRQSPKSRERSMEDIAFVFVGFLLLSVAVFVGVMLHDKIGRRAEIPQFWLAIILGMLGGASVISGLIIGSNHALRRIFGLSQDTLCGYAQDDAIGLIPLAFLEVAFYSVLGGLLWIRVNPDRLLYGFVIGGIAGVFQTYVLKRLTQFKVTDSGLSALEKQSNVPAETVQTLQHLQGQIFPDKARFMQALEQSIGNRYAAQYQSLLCQHALDRTGRRSVGGMFGSCGGWLMPLVVVPIGGMFIETRFNFWLFVGLIVILGILAMVYTGSLLGRFASEIVTGGILFATILGTGISIVAGVMLWAEAGFGVGITGAGLGAVLSFLASLIIQWIVGVMLLLSLLISHLVSVVLAPLLIMIRYSTIICQHCLRYAYPFKSRYEAGTRYCEHCQKPVERTDVVGKVIFTFGTFTLKLDNDEIQLANPNFELIKRPGRVFICSNPGFKAAERGVDVSEVYIDTKTCELHRLERFMTYIVHTPLTYGLQSVKIFYQGELDDLGENLKNALRNTFKWIEAVH